MTLSEGPDMPKPKYSDAVYLAGKKLYGWDCQPEMKPDNNALADYLLANNGYTQGPGGTWAINDLAMKSTESHYGLTADEGVARG